PLQTEMHFLKYRIPFNTARSNQSSHDICTAIGRQMIRKNLIYFFTAVHAIEKWNKDRMIAYARLETRYSFAQLVTFDTQDNIIHNPKVGSCIAHFFRMRVKAVVLISNLHTVFLDGS